jgi:hypothetical protein
MGNGQGKGRGNIYTNLNVERFFRRCVLFAALGLVVGSVPGGPHDAGTHVRGCAEALVPSNVS